MRSGSRRWILVSVAAVLYALPAAAEIRNLYPTDDATLDQQDPDTTLGSSTDLLVRNEDNGVSTDLEMSMAFRFDLSDVLPGSTIGGATLYVYYYG